MLADRAAMKWLAALVLATCTACGSDTGETETPVGDAVAAPVAAPIRARDALVRSLETQKQHARQRESAFDQLTRSR